MKEWKNYAIEKKMYLILFLMLYTVINFIDIMSFGFVARNIAINTLIGFMLIPTYLSIKRDWELIKDYKHNITDLVLYLGMILIIIVNALIHTDVIYNISILHGQFPAFLSLESYSYAGLFLITMAICLKDTFPTFIKNIIAYTLVLIGMISIIVYYLNPISALYSFGNINYAGEPYAIMYLFLIVPMLTSKINIRDLLISSFLLFVSFFSNSRGLQLSMVFTILFIVPYLYYGKKLNTRNFLIILLQITVVFTVYYFITNTPTSDVNRLLAWASGEISTDQLSSSRLEIWSGIIRVVTYKLQYFLIGIGPSSLIFYGVANNNAHNMYFSTLAAFGVIGTILFAILLFRLLIAAFKVAKHNHENTYLLAALIFVFFKWMFNTYVMSTGTYTLLVFGLIIINYAKLKKENSYEVN